MTRHMRAVLTAQINATDIVAVGLLAAGGRLRRLVQPLNSAAFFFIHLI
jgi:hypothetical protein